MSKLTERTVLLAKEETTYGVDSNPTAEKDFIAVYDVAVNPDITFNDPRAMDASLSPREGRAGKKNVEVSFSWEIQLSAGEDKTKPIDPFVALLQACGFDETASGCWTPVSTDMGSCTIYVNYDGHLWKITGCRGNVEFDFTAGEFATATFTMRGLYQAPVDSAIPTEWVDLGVPPMKCMGGILVAMNQDPIPVVNNLNVNMNWDVVALPSITAKDAVSEIVLADRNPEGKFDPELTNISDHDWFAILEAPVLGEISYQIANASASLRLKVPKAQLTGVGYGDRDGIRTYEIPFRCVRNLGDDEVVLEFAGSGE